MDTECLAHLALALPDALVIVDTSGVVVWGNPAAERLFGVTNAEIVGSSGLELLHPDDRELAVVSLASVQAKDTGSPIELRVRTCAGWKLVELIGVNLLGKSPVDGLVLCLRDLTERRRWEVAGDATERFRSLVHNSAAIVMLIDTDGIVESVSAAITRRLGHDPELVEGRPLDDLVVAADRPAWRAALAQCLRGRSTSSGPTTVELEMRRRDSAALVPFELSIVNMLDDPTVGGLVVSAHDITQLRSARQSLERLATRDALTGLPNRALVFDRIEHMLAAGQRTGSPGDVLFVDLDRFKDVNDSLGHRVGDDVLREVARRFQRAVRASDSIGRLGGDEFVVLVEGPTASEADVVAQRLLRSLEPPFVVRSDARPELTVSASIGIVSGAYATAEDLLVDADIALYEAKALGRNRAVRFEPQMRGAFRSRIELERDLRAAFVSGEFFLVYQPVLSLTEGSVRNMEALLRWRQPSGRVVTPEAFIPALEESGLIVDVGSFVLHEACRQARQWLDRGSPTAISVNVSPSQFDSDTLGDDVRAVLEHSGLDPGSLILEMTETALMRDTVDTSRRLAELKSLGVRLAIDDFGTGYSSLAYLQHFPVDILKIDRRFIAGSAAGGPGEALVHALVELGNALGLETVAEGIETAEQLMHARREGADAGQGFYLSRPLDAGDAGLYLADTARLASTLVPTRPGM